MQCLRRFSFSGETIVSTHFAIEAFDVSLLRRESPAVCSNTESNTHNSIQSGRVRLPGPVCSDPCRSGSSVSTWENMENSNAPPTLKAFQSTSHSTPNVKYCAAQVVWLRHSNRTNLTSQQNIRKKPDPSDSYSPLGVAPKEVSENARPISHRMCTAAPHCTRQ